VSIIAQTSYLEVVLWKSSLSFSRSWLDLVVHLFLETGSTFGKLDRFLLLQQWEHLFCGLFVIPKTSKIIGPQLPVEVVRVAVTRAKPYNTASVQTPQTSKACGVSHLS
jgi:hypothetical protein